MQHLQKSFTHSDHSYTAVIGYKSGHSCTFKCRTCHKPYEDHPVDPERPLKRVLCDGTRVHA